MHHQHHRAMSAALIAAPTDKIMTLDEVKRHLRVDHADDDPLIQDLISAATEQLDPAAGGTLNRALRPQQWERRSDGFYDTSDERVSRAWDSECIPMPYAPVISIDSVKYDDANGVEQTMDPAAFKILGMGTKGKQSIVPIVGTCWPVARYAPESVRIRFTAGYPIANAGADPAVVDMLPASIKAWMKLFIGTLYERRETIVVGTSISTAVAELPPHIMTMISQFRVY